MILSSLLARNFRVFSEINLSFEPGMQLFLGRNAQGKTSLIEAVLFLATSLSHRTHREDELIRWGETAAFLRGVTEGGEGGRVIECGLEKKRKAIKIDGKPLTRVGDLYGYLRTVLFAPEDLAIVGGGPLDRRRFLDMAIAQLEADGNRVIVQKQSDASLADANVVSVNRGAPIRGTVMDDYSDRTYQQTITGYVYYVNVK